VITVVTPTDNLQEQVDLRVSPDPHPHTLGEAKRE
jgi:hypothetical protein